MTPTQLIEDLNLPEDKIARIKALAASFMDFEEILHEHGEEHTADTPFRQGMLTQSQQCIDLAANIVGQTPEAVKEALLGVFGITQEQYANSCTMHHQIIALSGFVGAKQS